MGVLLSDIQKRHRAYVLLLISLFFAGNQLCAAESKAIGVSGSALSNTSEGGQKWALVVGISNYHNVPVLSFARRDGEVVAKVLVESGFPKENIMLMTDNSPPGPLYPTRSNLRARIDQIAQMAGARDSLFIFFSGHGMQKFGKGYLVPIDGSGKDIGSLVPLSWVKEALESSPAKHKLLILDACHSGAKAGDAGDSPAKALLEPLGGAAFATISSCDVDQLSYENKESRHGVFTEALIEGLKGNADNQAAGNGDGTVTAYELWEYSRVKTNQWSAKSGKQQNPVFKGELKDKVEVVRYRTEDQLKAQKDNLRKKLETMEQLNRNSAAEELRKEIAMLETQLGSISGGVGDITGSDEVQLAYGRYDAAKKQVDDLKNLLAEKLKIYQPTSSAIAKIKQRIATAGSELKTNLQAKYQADAIMYEALQSQIDARQAQYDELTKELLPSAPQAKKLAVEISAMKDRQQTYVRGYLEANAKTNSLGMKLVWIPAGEFMMGSSNGDSGERPVHRVKLTKGFYMGQCEVTQAQYKAVMGTSPWSGETYARSNSFNAASYISWNDAMEFCKKLSQKDGRNYTLPTEAQWEYACRAGTETVYSFGDSSNRLGDYAWYASNAWDKGEKYAHPVGQKKPNAFGLYDMHGNVWEWCRDYYANDFYEESRDVDPENIQSSGYRVLRGGSWLSDASYCRSATRYGGIPDNRDYHLGFRVVLFVSSLDF